MNKVLDNSQRAKNVIIIFYILGAGYIALLISSFMQYQLLKSDWFTIIQNANTNDTRHQLIAIVNVLIIIVTIVLFIMWYRRAYHNLHKAGVKGLTTSEGWAAGCWFVPILNFFRPYQIMAEIWTETRNFVKRNGGNEFNEDGLSQKTSSNTLLGFWWGSWILSGLVSNVSNQMIKNDQSLSNLQNATMVEMLGTVMSLACLVMIIVIIKESQKDQDKFLVVWENQEADNGTFSLSDDDEILV